jgi:hypothetical protein
MTRNDFIRKSLIALTGLAIVPALSLDERLEIAPVINPEFSTVNVKAFKVASQFIKVSDELLDDKEEFDREIDMLLKDFTIEKEDIIEIKAGFMDDDFLKNVHSVLIKYKLH